MGVKHGIFEEYKQNGGNEPELQLVKFGAYENGLKSGHFIELDGKNYCVIYYRDD